MKSTQELSVLLFATFLSICNCSGTKELPGELSQSSETVRPPSTFISSDPVFGMLPWVSSTCPHTEKQGARPHSCHLQRRGWGDQRCQGACPMSQRMLALLVSGWCSPHPRGALTDPLCSHVGNAAVTRLCSSRHTSSPLRPVACGQWGGTSTPLCLDGSHDSFWPFCCGHE